MRILITGGAGFIGRNCAARFGREGHYVRCVDNLSAASVEILPDNLLRVDVRELTAADLDVDVILHLAALKSVPGSFVESAQILHNIAVDHHMLRIFSEAAQPRRLVMASSCEVYGNQGGPAKESLTPSPRSPYAVGKVAIEYLADVYRTLHPEKQISVLRLHNVFGPDEGGEAVVSSFIDSLLLGRPLVIEGSGEQARDFTYIDDACEMIARVVLAAERPADVLNIGSGSETAIAEIAEILGEFVGGRPTVRHVDPRPNEIATFVADMSAYQQHYGEVSIRPIREGLRSAFTRRAGLREVAVAYSAPLSLRS